MSERAWRLAPVAAAALMVAAYFAIDPRVSDLPAAEFRTWLFEHEGPNIWNGQWYAGHHTPGYSILFPAVAALLGGPEVVGALSVLASAAIFAAIVDRHFGPRARWGALWFGLGAGTLLFSARLPWGLGAAFGLAAVLALQRRRPWLAAALAVLTTLSSPVAGAFLALAGVAYALARKGSVPFLADDCRRRDGALLAVAGLAPPLVLTAAFPEGGYQPFVFSSFFVVPLVAVAAIPFFTRDRVLRIACVLYALAAVGLYLVHTPFGGNAVRLGQLVGGPLLLCAVLAAPPRAARWRAGAAVLLAVLAWWQWAPTVREARKVADDPSTEAAYYQPLLRFIDAHPGPPGRIAIPQLRSQWESYYVAKQYPSARGWARQVDIELNPLFYGDRPLDPERYRRWLEENAVRWVALPDAPIGDGGRKEVALIERGVPPYLRELPRAGHWRVFEFTRPHPLVVPGRGASIRATAHRPDQVDLHVDRPGSAIVRVHFTPYWRLDGPGCVERAGDWTRISAERPGRTRLVTTFSPSRVIDRGRRCG